MATAADVNVLILLLVDTNLLQDLKSFSNLIISNGEYSNCLGASIERDMG